MNRPALVTQMDQTVDGAYGDVCCRSHLDGKMKIVSFVKVIMYDITDNVVKVPDSNRMQDFISIPKNASLGPRWRGSKLSSQIND